MRRKMEENKEELDKRREKEEMKRIVRELFENLKEKERKGQRELRVKIQRMVWDSKNGRSTSIFERKKKQKGKKYNCNI